MNESNNKKLFSASFLTLVAAGIGFSVRGIILKDWGNQFGFTQSELGTISGGGLIGFGLTIIALSFVADAIGYGKLMLLAFTLHASSAVVTFAATPVYAMYGKEGAFWCLSIGMWLFAFGNGACEAVINPLTASLYPQEKTKWLNILHAGWPLGLILGAVIGLVFESISVPVRWEIKLGIFLIPVLAYGMLMFNKSFPRSEASMSGVSVGSMLITIFSPLIVFLFLLHAMVGYVELGTDSWIVNITGRVLENVTYALLAFIWINSIMFVLRFFAGPIVHKINPIGLLFVSAILGSTGLALLGSNITTGSIVLWMVASTIFALGKTFYWPTLLGVISERFPKGGALALGISGGIGMITAGYLGAPGIGYKQDYFSVEKLKDIAPETYDRYVSRTDDGKLSEKGFPIVTGVLPKYAPPVAGLDNGKLKIQEDYAGVLAAEKAGKKGELTTLESDVATLEKEKAANKPVEPALDKSLHAQLDWWNTQGKPNYAVDQPKLKEATTYGAKTALLYTAGVPAMMAIGFLLLLLYFKATGGYKQIHIGDEKH
ncbi:MFS transporter [soil metagenome]